MKKAIKVTNRKRNWLFKQTDTLVISKNKLIYRGQSYTFEPMTDKQRYYAFIYPLRKFVKEETKPWWKRVLGI